jgi:hypothetical protein
MVTQYKDSILNTVVVQDYIVNQSLQNSKNMKIQERHKYEGGHNNNIC